MDWTWLWAPGGLAGVILTWILRRKWDSVKTRAATSFLGRQITLNRMVLDLQTQLVSKDAVILTKNDELTETRASFERQLVDKDKELATKDSILGYQELALETLNRNVRRLLDQLHGDSTLNPYGEELTKHLDSPKKLQTMQIDSPDQPDPRSP